MTANDHYQAGRLNDAVAAALDDVKKNPTDKSKRYFLAELLCFSGEYERAERQLDAIGDLEPEKMMDVALFRQMIIGEQVRQQFFAKGRMPEFLNNDISPQLKMHLEAAVLIRGGSLNEANALLAQAQEQRPKAGGTLDGKPFEDMIDLDDLTSSFFEVITSRGEYFWIPMHVVDTVEFRPIARPRDLLWRPAHMIVRGGPDGDVFLPVLYPGSAADANDAIRLGRATEWRGGEGAPIRGAGQRMFLVGEEDKSILELKKLRIAAPA